ARPPSIENAGIGPDLIAFGVEMMLDRRGAPNAHFVGGLEDVEPLEQRLVVEFGVAAERASALAPLFAVSRQHRVKLQDHLGLHESASSILVHSLAQERGRLRLRWNL